MSSIIGDLTLENSKLKAKLAESQAEVRKFRTETERQTAGIGDSFAKAFDATGIKGALVGALGGGTLVGAAQAIKAIAEEYAQLYATAIRFGESTDGIQRLDVMARRSGTSVGSLVGSLRNAAQAAENLGDDKVRRALSALGLSSSDLIGGSNEQRLERLAEAYRRVQDAGKNPIRLFEDLGLGEAIPLLQEFQQHKQAASEIELIKEDELKKLKEGIASFDQLINKGKAFVGKNVSQAMEHPGEFLAANAGPLSVIFETARHAITGKETKSMGAQKLIELFGGSNGPGRTPDQAWKEATTGKDDPNVAVNKDLRESIARGQMAFQNPLEKSGALLERFAGAVGMESSQLTSATQIRDIMGKLMSEANSARDHGDSEGEGKALKKYSDAQGALSAFASSDVGSPRVAMGGLGGDINRLLGKSGTELVAERQAEGNTILGRIEAHLRAQATGKAFTQRNIWQDGGNEGFSQ